MCRRHPTLRAKTTRGRTKEVSKTEQIANVFQKRPLENISPKDISLELEMEIQLVTSIVSRLRSEGLIERVGWGKYRLRMDQTIAEEVLQKVARDFTRMTNDLLTSKKRAEVQLEGGPFDQIVHLYVEVKKVGGDVMAQNLLRLAARKNIPLEDVKVLVGSVKEVVGG